MASPPNIRRIRTEDFEPEYRQLIERISFAITEFQDQTIFNLNKGIDFRNLNQDFKDITVDTDGSGAITNPIDIVTDLKSRPRMVIVGNVVNQRNPGVAISGQPFVSFTSNTTSSGRTVRINGITNLDPDSRYTVTVLIIGENL